MSKDKNIVGFPENSSYQELIDKVKRESTPVGGAPMPTIPNLTASNPDSQRKAQMKSAMLTPEQQQELVKQGKYIPGVGASYAANQPSAHAIPPQSQQQTQAQSDVYNPPRPEGAGLSPETVRQLQEVAKANNTTPPKEEELKKEIDDVEDEFDVDEYGNRVRNLLANKDRRDLIEARCTPMDLEDLLIHQEVKQTVPIVPGKFEPTYRSTSGAEDLFVKRLMGKERGPDRYILDKFSLMNLTMGLHAINGRPLLSHLDAHGRPDEKLFDAKFDQVLKYPMPLLADLGVNYIWFDRRVRKLMVVDQIKGF